MFRRGKGTARYLSNLPLTSPKLPYHDETRTEQKRLNATMTDADLIETLRSGDPNALGTLYDCYGALVYSLALRILGNLHEAEDLTQEIFLSLHQGGTYRPQRGSLGAYLTTLTRSRAIDRLRSRSNRHQILTRWHRDMTNPSPALPTEQASLQERQEKVQRALSQLSEPQRQVLELSYYDGLSQSEIAKRLQKPLGTVKTWARKGLLNLRDQLQEETDNV